MRELNYEFACDSELGAFVVEPQVTQVWHGDTLTVTALAMVNRAASISPVSAEVDHRLRLTHKCTFGPGGGVMSLRLARMIWRLHGLKKQRVYEVELHGLS